MSIDLGDIDLANLPIGYHLDRAANFLWNFKVFRKMIEGAERQHAEYLLALSNVRSHQADGAVTTAGNNYGCLAIHRMTDNVSDLLVRFHNVKRGVDP